MTRSRIEDILPLQPLQEGFLFHSLVADGAVDVYTSQVRFDLAGVVDGAALRRAGERLLARHANLRAGFRHEGVSRPVQVVYRRVRLPWAEVDVSGAVDVEGRAAEVAAEDRLRPFELGRPPLLRLSLLRLGEDRYRLLLTGHHILWDGWSVPVLVEELFRLYAAEAVAGGGDAGLPVVTPYREYLAWLGRQDRDAAERAWSSALEGLPEPTLVAPDNTHGKTALQEYVTTDLPRDLLDRITALSRRYGVTLNTVVQGVWGLLLARQTGREDVVFGATVSGRPPELEGVERMLGLFINTLPVRVRLRAQESVIGLLTRLQQEQSQLIPHHHYGLSDIQRQSGFGTLFDTTMVVENYPLDPSVFTEALGDLELKGIGFDDATHYPLSLAAIPAPGAGLTLKVSYRPDVYDREEAQRISSRLVHLLRTVVDDPEQPTRTVDVLPPAEREFLLSAAGPVVSSASVERCVHEVFEERVAAAPDAVAVVFGEASLTYAELDARANQLAHHLRSLGVGPESLVGVCLERGLDLVPSLLGVLKAGAGYLPLDPASPADRMGYVLADAGAQVVVTSDALVPVLEGVFEGELVVLDRDAELIAARPVSVPESSVTSDSTVYVIYTSGSTGRPKGVVLAHANVVRLFETAQVDFGFGPDDVWTLFHSYAFDFSVWEVFGALLHGGRLVVVPEMTAREPSLFHELLVREGVTVLNQTPSAFTQLIEEDRTRSDAGGLALRTVVFGGAALDCGALQGWVARHGLESPRLVNMYGITETTVHVTYGPVGAEELAAGGSASPIGRPLNDLSVHLLDRFGELVPVGVPGEIHVGGPGVARGYLNRPELTAERFVPDPFGPPGSRLYRSGDLACRRADGSLEFLGRIDDQVKVRGYRIEPGEISARLSEHPAVRDAVVIVRDERLVAYLVSDGEAPSTADLRAFVARVLPEYMVPVAFVVLGRLPLTVNGKVDRGALPAPEFVSGVGRGPRSGVEEVLCSLFAEVLGLDRVGVADSFFDCGGDSIMAIQLVSRARRAGWVLSARDVFQHPSVERLARVVVPVGDAGVVVEASGAGVGVVPLTPVMGWLRDLAGPVEGFHQHVVVGLPEGASRESLVGALQAVVDRHDMLRSRLVRDGHDGGGEWRLEVAPPGAVDAGGLLDHTTTTDLDEASVLTAIDERAEAERLRLDPDAGVVFRAVWFEPGQLLLVAHHLVVDGVSWRILLEDLKAASEGRELEPAATSFRTWARRLREEAEQGTYTGQLELWRRIVGEPGRPLGSRDLDAAKDTVTTRRVTELSLSVELTEALLTRVPALFHGGVNDVLLTGLALAVQEWQRRRGRDADAGVLLDLEGHGRFEAARVDLSRTVGWFTSIHPVRLDAGAGGVSWDEVCAGGAVGGRALKLVKEQVRAVPDDGVGFGVLRYLDPAAGAELAAGARAELGFNYLGRFTNGGDGAWELSARAGMVGGGADAGLALAHALEVNAVTYDLAEGPRLQASWAWADGVLSEAEVRELAQLWFQALEGLARHADAPDAGGLTPSDLDLVPLDQAEIELLEDGGAEVEDILPLQPLQEGFLFHSLVADGAVDVYTSQVRFDLAGVVDGAALRRAGERLLARHANLRAGFRHEGVSRPVQVVYRRVRLPWAEVDVSGAVDVEGRAAEVAAEDRLRPFELGRPPLLRLSLLRLGEDRYRLLLTGHHILWDGWSVPVLVEELFRLYAAEAVAGGGDAGLPVVTPYREYLAWLGRQDRDAAERAWSSALEGLPEPTLVAPDNTHDRNPVQDMVRTEMPKELTEALAATGRRYGVTLNTVVQGVWGLLLARQTGREDVVFGATVSGRPPELEGVERMLGLFINTLPVRVRLRAQESVIGLLTRLQQEQSQLIPHHHYGLSDIQRQSGFGTLFDTTTVLTNYPLDPSVLDTVLGDLEVLDIDNEDATHYPLRMAVVPDGSTLGLRLGYLPDLYTRDEAQRMLDRVLHLLETLAADPERLVSSIDLLTEAERHQLLVEWGGY
ncbi:non-ribosomal peptide synthetase [Streptomyces phaeochromogenes]|uniref:non-ribosomal peptide synthetase n=1 Tax=Streptomyces phaeochromogenes TaxID=1923 RepID=UPI002DDAEE88|nr:non-ribosomal peptide synthetase [Streptomyces phaeochromogenes]WRZ31128.1 amino acid adenylation domain-containing protein [Streptomyces phaeochromogenes]